MDVRSDLPADDDDAESLTGWWPGSERRAPGDYQNGSTDVPEAEGVVLGGAGQRPIITGKSDIANVGGMALVCADRFERSGVPENDGGVAAAAGHQRAIVRKRHDVNVGGVICQCALKRARCDIPDLDGVIATGTDQRFAVARERDGKDGTFVAGEGAAGGVGFVGGQNARHMSRNERY